MARLRSAPSVHPPPPSTKATQPPRQALRDRTNTTRKKAAEYEDDGNIDNLIKDARPRRGRAKEAKGKEDDYVMAGGLGQVDSQDEAPVNSDPPLTPDDLAKSDGPPPPTAKANRRPPRMTRKLVQSQSQSKVLEDVKRRMQATAPKQTAPKSGNAPAAVKNLAPSPDSLPTGPTAVRRYNNPVAERSDFSLSRSPPPPGKLNSVKRSSLAQPGSALRPQSTPGVETSILALKNFKRRPRQPSMLQMVQQRIGSARPSAVNAQATEDPSVFDAEGIEDDGEEFAPEAEGTPLQASKAKQLPAGKSKRPLKRNHIVPVAPTTTSASRKRKSDDVDHSSSALDALRAKRQKPTALELDAEPLDIPRQSQSARRSSSVRQITPQPQITSDVQVINSSPSSTPPTEPSSSARHGALAPPDAVIPSTEKERDELQFVPLNDLDDDRQQDDIPNGTMAEPASSSPPPPEPLIPDTQRTDVMAEPLTQLSPPRPKQREKAKKKAKPLNTATLQALLPKRRQPPKPRHRKSEYDIDSESEDDSPLDTSHLQEDEDELSGNLRRQTKAAAPPKGMKSAASKAKARSRQSKAAPTNRKSSAAPPARKSTAPSSSKKGATKTYSRNTATTSDKENEDYESLDEHDDSVLPETSVSMVDAAQSKEIEQSKKKFAELDQWEMEFESMSVEEGRSSSQAWR